LEKTFAKILITYQIPSKWSASHPQMLSAEKKKKEIALLSLSYKGQLN
jgi:hypothetical protein